MKPKLNDNFKATMILSLMNILIQIIKKNTGTVLMQISKINQKITLQKTYKITKLIKRSHKC